MSAPTTLPGRRPGGKPATSAGQEVLVQISGGERAQGSAAHAYIPCRTVPGFCYQQGEQPASPGRSKTRGPQKAKEIVEQITTEEGLGFIVRTAGMNRTKQELNRDYQHLSRLWKEIQKRAAETPAPALIYQESDFGVRSLRDYYTPDIEEILVDDGETFRQMRAYCKAVAPRNLKVIKLDKEKTPIFDKYQLEDQIRVIYQVSGLEVRRLLVITPPRR